MKILKLTLAAAVALSLVSCSTTDEKQAAALAKRVMGPQAGQVVFQQIKSDKDTYELSQKGSKVLIKGNNANSMAVGLNRYLQQYCLTNVSWYDFNPVELPAELPAITDPVKGSAEVPERFFLNYCTFGYTMPWWKWEQWERFIDWMALNGVNMPLAITGQEAVWQKVWRKYGLTDEQIRAFFVGPAHLPWQRMCNVDRWQGPLPQGWIDGQAELQKRILKRERALNMKPVLPAFSGHVPAELAEAVTGAPSAAAVTPAEATGTPSIATVTPAGAQIDTFRVSFWGGFADKYRCTFLSPMDPLYAKIQKDYMQEQTRMYGTDHIYGVDPFNEVDAPFWDPETLAKISKGIYDSMTAVDPEAVWLQMGWLFYADEHHWTDGNIRAYLTAVPQGRMIILDYFCDHTQVWQRTEKFYGQKYIWCYLGNFGGMTGIEGDLRQNSRWIADTKANGGPGFVGIGSTLEGFGVNEPIYEAVLARAWDNCPGDDAYIDNIADRHLGRKDEAFRAYWRAHIDKVSVTHSKTSSSSIICAHPNLEGVWHWTTLFNRGYDTKDLEEALLTLETVEGESDYFKFDLANARRQVLDNRALAVRDRFAKAYYKGDRQGMVEAADEFLGLCDQLADVLKTRTEFSLCNWIDDARSWGKTAGEKDYYEMNARTIISVWGDSFHLCDYANRDYDGLVETYYKVRWQMFFDAVLAAFDAGEPFVNAKSTGYVGYSPEGTADGVIGRALQLDRDIWDFECRWAHIR